MKIIDLTHEINPDMPTFGAKWHCKTVLEQMGTVDTVGRNTTKITFGSHCGTHIDSPAHFIKNGKTIDELKLCDLIGEVNILDFSYLKENECVTVEMLENTEIKPRVIFNFGWSKNFYKSAKEFYNNYPYFSDDAIDYLIAKGVKLVGMDTPSPDDSRIKLGSLDDSKAHKKFLSNGVILIEYLNNLEEIDCLKGWKLIAMPLKLKNCDGSSARVCLIREE